MKTIFTIGVIGIIFCFYMLIRNFIVFEERDILIEKIYIMGNIDINNNKNDYHWRHQALVLYPYNKMMWELFKFNWSYNDIVKNYNQEIRNLEKEMEIK